MSNRAEFVVEKLEAHGSTVNKTGSQWIAQCPAHDDHDPSLSISEGDAGRVLLNCFAGCSPKDVVAALGMTMKDLFEPDLTKSMQIGEKKEYIYRDEGGEIVFRVVRSGNKEFRLNGYLGNGNYAYTLGDARKVLYNLQAVGRAIQNGDPIFIVEGEKDSETLMLSGLVATTNPTGADNGTGGKFTAAMVEQLEGSTQINIIIDNDTPGEMHGRYLCKQLQRSGRNINIYRPTIGKDITEHLAGGGTMETLELLDSTFNPTGWIENAPAVEQDSWMPIDLGPYLSGTIENPIPTILEMTNGNCLFYLGKVNAIWGPSGEGKTWIQFAAFAQEIQKGHHVAYIDFEDRATTAIERLTTLGIKKNQISKYFHYVRPDDPSDSERIQRIVTFITELGCTLVGLDSVGEALALDGKNPNADEEIAGWNREVAKRLAENGMGVVLVDHTPKGVIDPDGPIGSQRKMAAIDGLAYLVKTKRPFSREPTEVPGEIHIKVKKDRHGTYTRNSKVAIALVHVGERMSITLYDPKEPIPDIGQSSAIRDDHLVEIISDWIWTERDKIFSGVICETNISEFKKKMPSVTFRQVRAAVAVLRGSEYSVADGATFRLVKRFHATPQNDAPTSPDRTPTDENETNPDAPTSPDTRPTSTPTEPRHSKGDHSESTPTSHLTLLRDGVLSGLDDDTPNGFYQPDRFSDEELFADTQPNNYDRSTGR